MSRRGWFNDATFTSQGLVFCAFSFLTNDTSDPATTSFRGCGGLTGSDGATSVSNSGPSAVASISRTDVGDYLVTFADGYRYAVAIFTSISGGSGYTVDYAAPSNEGEGHGTAVTLALSVVDDEGAAVESTGRRVSVLVVLKDSGNGT
jgi:hypothetical protein